MACQKGRGIGYRVGNSVHCKRVGGGVCVPNLSDVTARSEIGVGKEGKSVVSRRLL